MLKNRTPITFPIPVSPFSLKKSYTIKSKASGLALHSSKSAIVQTSGDVAEWQLIFDGKGYFTIKNRLSGKVLAAGPRNDSLIQVTDSKKDNVKWHLEWDGTGDCLIVSKTNHNVLSSENTNTTLIPGSIKPDEVKLRDDLHWQIIEQ